METRILVSADEINNAYRNVAEVRAQYLQATLDNISAKITLDNTHSQLLVSGVIVGKNADERQAKAREILVQEYARVEETESAERKARLDYEIATYEVERVRSLLRLAEVLTNPIWNGERND